MTDTLWLTNARLITPHGIVEGTVHVADGRIVAIRRRPPRDARTISLRGRYLAPGFIDLHVWGDPARVSRVEVAHGTTAFLSAIGPEPPDALVQKLAVLRVALNVQRLTFNGARCLGAHLEGPFLNLRRAGALPTRGMRRPTSAERRTG